MLIISLALIQHTVNFKGFYNHTEELVREGDRVTLYLVIYSQGACNCHVNKKIPKGPKGVLLFA